MKKFTILFLAILALLPVAPEARAQQATEQVQATVNASDAQLVDVGMVCVDFKQWAVEDTLTHAIDTVYTAEPYILWQRNGDIDAQMQEIKEYYAGYKGLHPEKFTI